MNERVILTQFLERGVSLPNHPFLQQVLSYFCTQLHHLMHNGVVHLSCFVTLCEACLGIEPSWVLFKHIFLCEAPDGVEGCDANLPWTRDPDEEELGLPQNEVA